MTACVLVESDRQDCGPLASLNRVCVLPFDVGPSAPVTYDGCARLSSPASERFRIRCPCSPSNVDFASPVAGTIFCGLVELVERDCDVVVAYGLVGKVRGIVGGLAEPGGRTWGRSSMCPLTAGRVTEAAPVLPICCSGNGANDALCVVALG